MSRPTTPSGMSAPKGTTASAPAVAAEGRALAPGPAPSTGRTIVAGRRAARRTPRGARSSKQGRADGVPGGGEEGVGHRAAHDDGVGASREHASTIAELVGDLGAADDRDERAAAGTSSRPRERRPPRAARVGPAALGHQRGRHDDRGVGAVRRAEGLVDVVVDALDQRRAEDGVVGLLARGRSEGSRAARPRAELGQALAHRLDAVALVDAGPWGARGASHATTERPARPSGRSSSGSVARMRKSSATSRRPSTSATGRVEVDAHEDALAREVAPALEAAAASTARRRRGP